jgi:hypothetical protein
MSCGYSALTHAAEDGTKTPILLGCSLERQVARRAPKAVPCHVAKHDLPVAAVDRLAPSRQAPPTTQLASCRIESDEEFPPP